MSHPCTINSGQPCGKCRLCDLYATSERHRRHWDSQPAVVTSARQPAAVAEGQCRHLGGPTGETVRCPTCRGHVELKLYHCAVYGECTLAKKVDGVACCRQPGGCPGYNRVIEESIPPEPATKTDETVARLTAPLPRRRRGREVVWAYGVTTVPSRRDDLLPQTLASLKVAGFDKPKLFVDGATNHEALWWERTFNLEVVVRNPRIRTFGNWVMGLVELYIRQPEAERFAMFQDDLVACRGLRKYLERLPYPDGKDRRPLGYWNLLTFPENQALAPRNQHGGTIEGWFPSNQKGKGAVALVFDRATVGALLTSYEHIIDRPLTAGKRAWSAIDGGIVDALRKKGWTEFCHSPSLVRHTGNNKSSMRHLPFPMDESFPGESFDATRLLEAK